VDDVSRHEVPLLIGSATEHGFHALPSETPLAMPEQLLRDRREWPDAPQTAPYLLSLRRAFVFGVVGALSAAGAFEMYQVLKVAGLTFAESIVLGLFVALFAWLALSFVSAAGGLLSMILRSDKSLGIDPSSPVPHVTTRNALLLPAYNESAGRISSRLQAICESVQETGQHEHFDFFILSDTTDPKIWISEEAAFLALLQRMPRMRIFYRHRAKNTARKAGNIAEWIRRFGGAYRHMIVLDADSLMTGDTILRLVAAMERHPRVGLIQTFPVIVNADTLFARVQQFAGRMYGPLIARGIAWWHGPEGNYWGHNAVIRVAAFAEHAGLPRLRGCKPFGGHIMSHDFVEAGLMRRAGWAIHMAPNLGGTYEEAPPSLTDYAARDRRWCQGNLQHVGVLTASGLHWISRLHLLTGIGSYLTAPLWLLFLAVGILISLEAQFVRPDYFPSGFSLFPNWPAQDPVLAAWVFAATMGVLLAPKLLGYVVAVGGRERRMGFGGPVVSLLSVIVETLISGLVAPLMMLIQSTAVTEILFGRDAGWSVQRRDDGTLPLSEVVRRYGWHTLFGVALAASAYSVSWSLLLWMTPVISGLLLAIPLAALSASSSAAAALRRLGLLTIPEESNVPPIVARANELADNSTFRKKEDAIVCLCENSELRIAHRSMISTAPRRKRGEIDVDLVVGRAKLGDAQSRDEATALLSEREITAVLSDLSAFDQLMALCDRGMVNV